MKFLCDVCEQKLQAPDQLAGQRIECPSCGQKILVPGSAPQAPAEPAAPAAPSGSPPSPPSSSFAGKTVGESRARLRMTRSAHTPVQSSPADSPAAGRSKLLIPGRLTVQRMRSKAEKQSLVFLSCAAAVPVLGGLAVLGSAIASGGWKAGAVLGVNFAVVVLAIALGRWFASKMAAAYIRVNGIEVADDQFSALQELICDFAERFECPAPTVYLMQDCRWNAFAARLAGHRLVVLLSGATDSLLRKDLVDDLSFLVGHELGHHFAGHLGFRRQLLALLGAWMPWFLLWYRRGCELTCDRYGLVCVGSVTAAEGTICTMTVGRKLAQYVDVAAAIRQWQRHRREFFVRWRTLYCTHPHRLSRLRELAIAGKQLGLMDS